MRESWKKAGTIALVIGAVSLKILARTHLDKICDLAANAFDSIRLSEVVLRTGSFEDAKLANINVTAQFPEGSRDMLVELPSSDLERLKARLAAGNGATLPYTTKNARGSVTGQVKSDLNDILGLMAVTAADLGHGTKIEDDRFRTVDQKSEASLSLGTAESDAPKREDLRCVGGDYTLLTCVVAFKFSDLTP